MIRNTILYSIFLFVFISLSAQHKPEWMRYPAISPDGSQIAFSYRGDIYLVNSGGGIAFPLTTHEAHEFMPVWSHDGSKIAFASDRYGNFDVFVMPSTGGNATRLTFHSAGDLPSGFTHDDRAVLFSSSRLDVAENQMYPSGLLSELYKVPVEGGRVVQMKTTPALNTRMSKDGNILLYHDIKGYEDEFRKHHTSSVTRDVWQYNIAEGKYIQLSSYEGEDRNPVFAPDEQSIYYLSEKNGTFNVYQLSPGEGTEEQITFLEHHPVRHLSIDQNGVLCFVHHGQIYTKAPGEEIEKIEVMVLTDDRANEEKILPITSGITEFELSPNEKEIAFVARGEVFVASVDKGTTRRITNTAEQERNVSFSPDGRSIMYAGERNGSWNIYQSTIQRSEEPYFFTATLIEEKAIVESEFETFQPSYSPDGKEVAFLQERTALMVINLETKQIREIMPGDKSYSYSDGDQFYQWSPDGKWFLVQFYPENTWNWDVGLISSKGGEELINLSNTGYTAARPQWMMDGKMVLWFSNRDGMKNHASWGSEMDLYGAFLTQEAYDQFTLSEEEYKIHKDKTKEEKKDEDNESDKDNEKAKETKKENLKIEVEGLKDRTVKLSIHSSRLSNAYVSKDGEKLYYLARFEKGYNLWETHLRTKETKILAALNSSSGGQLIAGKEDKNLYILSGGKLTKVETSSGKISTISVSGELILKPAAEREYLFEHIWRQVLKKFYVTDLHGVNWEFYKEQYQNKLSDINNDHDFAELLSEMLGELNASHTGARYRPNVPTGSRTASLGLFYDEKHTGTGLKISKVMDKGPAIKEGSKIKSGIIVEKIDGHILTPDVNHFIHLNRRDGQNVLLSLYDPSNGQRWDEVVKPVTIGQEFELRYKIWIENNRKMVEELSGGKIGYVHVRSMNDQSFRSVYEDVLGVNRHKEALVVDTRFNGGGWLHDDLATFLNGKDYMTFMPRGQNLGNEPQFKWSKPSVVVMSESNYSDAHMFPYAYKVLGIGKLVGMPVPGTGTAVWWETLQNGIVFGIPQVGNLDPEGDYLENKQLEPDILVPNEPAIVRQGRDQQLEAAVKELLSIVD